MKKRKPSVLIIEDDAAQRTTLTALLTDEGFETVGCGTAAEALEQVRQHAFDVAIVDLRLPDLAGTELVKELRTTDRDLRAIINTAYASFGSAKEAVNLGAFAYVEKAGDPSELIAHVHRACQEGPRAAQRQAASGEAAAHAVDDSWFEIFNRLLKKKPAKPPDA